MSEVTPQTRPSWIWPRADSHVVLGVEGAPDVYKTFVEPGGAFSPGVGSFGVSLWVWLEGERRLVAPERMARPELRDRLLGGMLPIVRSRWRAGDLEIDLRLAADGYGGPHQGADVLGVRVTNRGDKQVAARLLLAVRSLGPAGGPVRSIAYSAELRGLMVNDRPAVLGQRQPSAAGCCSPGEDHREISEALLVGEVPARSQAADADGWAGGCLAYRLAIDAGAVWEGGWDFPLWPSWSEPPGLLAARCQIPALDRLEALADGWRERLEATGVELPDARLTEAFYACLTHTLMAWVDDEARIASLCYPFFWLRDGAYQLHMLDKAGLHEPVRACLTRLLTEPWPAGGFGPEGDAPGQLLWLLAEHWLLTRDDDWLREIYPRVRERCVLLFDMRRRKAPLHAPQGRVLPRTRLHPDGTLVCEAARDGLIQGRMDWHRPVFWVNAWAFVGLRRAVEMARALGETGDAETWSVEAGALSRALASPAARFGSNERDFVCAMWPTDARHPSDPATRQEFERRWHTLRLDDQNHYHGEPRWRYFELGEAHNNLRLGERERTLLTLEQFLRSEDAPGLYAWAEGDFTGDPTGDWRFVRGWWPERRANRRNGSPIVPHGWVGAEFALLVRDLLVFEDDGALVIGAGVRPEWLGDCAKLGLRDAPTHYGRVSWRLEPRADVQGWNLTLTCRPGPPPLGYRLRLPLPTSAVVELDGVGIREEDGDWPIPAGGTVTTVQITVP
jgi:hypothetical protein